MSRYFSYAPDGGFEFHETAELAQAEADAAIDYYRDYADEGWSEDVSQVCWGELKQLAAKLYERPVEDTDIVAQGVDSIVDYGLKDIAQPASNQLIEKTDLALNEQDKAELVGMLNKMARHAEQESKIYFGADTNEAAVKRNSERQRRQADEAVKYRRWAESL